MNKILFFIAIPLGWAMFLCYDMTGSYAFAIILFTLLTKLILMPVALWVQKNGIKIVKIQPELNRIKADFFGDKNRIADETASLYKREKYNPFSNVLPMFIQILLLIGLIQVIYNPLSHLLRFDGVLIETLIQLTGSLTGANMDSSSIQLTVVEAIKNTANTNNFLAVEGVSQAVIEAVRSINMNFLGLNFALVPSQVGGLELLIPVLAGLAALTLSLVQNKLNPLQAQQTKASQWGTTAFSVGISLFLGAFVPIGVGFYWIFSNLFTIPQQLLLNVIINPKKHIDFEKLESSKTALAALESVGKKKPFKKDPHSKREKADYKKFFSVANNILFFIPKAVAFISIMKKLSVNC
jgi:YidC/Oxa1 family membrane protein insertase